MTNRILPALLVFQVVGKAFHDELVNSIESDFPVWRVLDGHSDESDVRVGGLLWLISSLKFFHHAQRVRAVQIQARMAIVQSVWVWRGGIRLGVKCRRSSEAGECVGKEPVLAVHCSGQTVSQNISADIIQ